MTAQARRQRNGLLVPWVVDWWAGREEQARLQAQGLDLDLTPHELHALGVAISEQRGDGHEPVQDLTLGNEAIEALGRVARERALVPAQDQDQDQDQRPRPPRSNARADRDGDPTGIDHGRGDHAERGEPETPVQNEKNDRERYWHELTKDRPGEEWTS
ncbi:MAG TPA: hypothetical protein VFJ69_08960 [Actinomycetota bacterium]|jgi:hypothetical protein|nr:hypothetical protein [Actinomycetota bacterium]